MHAEGLADPDFAESPRRGAARDCRRCAHGEQRLSVSHHRNGPTPRPRTTLTIQQNGAATFSLGYSDVQVGTTACESAVTVSVQFVKGGDAITVTPQYAVQPCNDGQLWLSPFYS